MPPRAKKHARPAPVRRSMPVKPDPGPLLLASGLEAEQVAAILEPYGIRSVAEADANIQVMAGDPHTRRQLSQILAPLLESVARTADPDQALNHWERLLASGVNRSALLEYLRTSPRMLDLLCTIFGNSDSLAFTLVRDPMLIYWLAEEEVLSRRPTRIGMEQALHRNLANLVSTELKLDVLRRFRRREMLRIGVRDLLRLADVPETTACLSDLASVLIHAAYEVADAELKPQYGVPMHQDRSGRWVETGFTVIGMGKLGGHELNYSSDVDLIYVYESHEGATQHGSTTGNGETPPVQTLTNEEYFEILARRLTRALADPTHEGHVFRVDLRLRAEGSVGQLARSLDDYAKYYRTRGQVWERLALLKAWPVAGSLALGRRFVRMVKPFILTVQCERRLDRRGATAVIESVKSVKDMIDEKLAGRGHERRNVKLGVGGIREIEFLVQTIQVLAGAHLPGLLDRSTLGALERFRRYGLLSARQQAELSAAYLFLRDVEHKLQMVHDLQTHALPGTDEELERCAIRVGFDEEDRGAALACFLSRYVRYTDYVHAAFRSLFHAPASSPLLRRTLRAVAAGTSRGRYEPS